MDASLERVLAEVGRVIVGKDAVVRKVLMALLIGGHVLLDDVPGVGKTTLASTLGKVLGLDFGRVQFTPDVLPSDICGFTMYSSEAGRFEYMPGILTQVNLLLCDEINRGSAKTQSALLEAMEEGQVTVDGTTHALREPFTVIATQNEVGSAGTQLLPHAQLDRFALRLALGYPDFAGQMEIIRSRQHGDPATHTRQAASRDDLLRMQAELREVEMVDSVLDYVTRLSFATRESELLELGLSPRAAIVLSEMARASAYVDGRSYTVPEDVAAVFADVSAHRVVLSREARERGLDARACVEHVLAQVAVPDAPR